MYHKEYCNFVRPTCEETATSKFFATSLNGETARKLYLEEVGSCHNSQKLKSTVNQSECKIKHKSKAYEIELSNLQLYHCVQNNDVDKLRQFLDRYPDKINTLDEFGWSLLMIACQANSIETVEELLKRKIDTAVRDKAGRSAQSLVIRNKNVILADILLKHSRQISLHEDNINDKKSNSNRLKENYVCEICDNKVFENKIEHLSSTIHNINASKGKKIPTKYVIPESNKGYQIMLKVGWDKEEGLGPDGTGRKYPIRGIQKKDKKGLGHKLKKKLTPITESVREFNKKLASREYDKHRRMEINFRREFY
ncbi:G patch domain and ankyrin repeat-containing protein 1 homolog [Vanessa tameamea]|uniref:G patch domain and ankyrin repeat-containing protein 1 homolog n=1 Tax=Vanessa tameamea TaxID=334116 RepID=A0A8B8IEY7_VANTA|nr:G patch domain and ankyrin repeat-containing protein 1 homolog [Vanessa tameamea]